MSHTIQPGRAAALSVAPQQIIGYVAGRPVRAIAGGDGTGGSGGGVGGQSGSGSGTGGQGGEGGGSGGSGQPGTGGSGTGTGGQSGSAGTPPDKGFPDGVAVEQMTAEQQAAYWKHHSRKWETRATKAPTPVELDELRRKAKAHDEAEDANKSELQKANDKIAEQAVALAEYQTTEVRQQAAREVGLPIEDAEWITATDLESAKEQAARLKERIGTPAGGGSGEGGGGGTNSGGRQGRGFAQGYQGGSGGGSDKSVAGGRELYQSRRRKNTTSS